MLVLVDVCVQVEVAVAPTDEQTQRQKAVVEDFDARVGQAQVGAEGGIGVLHGRYLNRPGSQSENAGT